MEPRDVVTLPDSAGDGDEAPVRLGRFELGRRLGEGGMGIVFVARDSLLDRAVALKVLHPGGGAGGPTARARLLREAQVLARLSHPNVVPVFEVGLAGDEIFVAMELVDGATLKQWMKEPHPWREIVDLFIAAGRGLAAVHALGLVHRDFKPSNVMIDRVGTPKVGDFGLVGLDDAATSSEGSGPSTISGEDLTVTGSVMGTPAYMAPEQRRGERADARADQFSFARTLVEALTGRLPDAHGQTEVPKPLRRILSRALAQDPALRYPSMQPLLAELARARRGSARWWLAAGGGAAVIAAVAVAWSLGQSPEPAAANPCPPPDPTVAAMWGRARQDAVRTRLNAIDPVQGVARFAAAARAIDPFVREWRTMHVDACRATRVRGAQSDTLFDLRMRCLGRRHAELDASVAALMSATDAAELDAALGGLVKLEPVAGCGDADALAATDPMPADPAERAALDELVERIQELEVAVRAGQLTGVPARADAVVADARRLGHPPTLAAALVVLSRVQLSVGDSRDAVATLRELTQVAASAHDDRDEAYAWTKLISVVGYDQGQPDEALLMVPAASAAVLRAGDTVDLRVDLLYGEALVLGAGSRGDDALARLAEARRLLEEAGATDAGSAIATRLADVLHETGSAQAFAGDPESAIASYRQAIAIWRSMLGPDSPDEAIGLHNVGEAYRDAGKLDDALIAVTEAARINEARTGETPQLASNLVSIAAVLAEQAEWERSLATYDRALRIFRAHLAPDDVQLAAVLTGRASALANAGRHDDALAAYAELVALIDKAGATTSNLPIALANRGNLLDGLGRHEDALVDYRRSAKLFEAQWGPQSAYLIYPLVGEGRCLVRIRRPAEAIAGLERAVALETAGGAALHAALARAWLGRALVDSRRDRARGLALARASRAAVAAAVEHNPDGARDLKDLDRWLADH